MEPTIRQDLPQQRDNAERQLDSAARSHIGKVRRVNEDAYLERADLGLWAVADGVGGLHAGDRASGLVVEKLGSIEHPGTGPGLLTAVLDRLDQAHTQLLREGATSGRPSATTVVALLISGRYFACAWAGDSRLYLWRAGELRQVTRDHTEAQAMVDAGLMTPEEAVMQTNRNAIVRAIGAGGKLELDLQQGTMEPGDIFLLCTDGLTKMVDDDEIAATLGTASPQASVERLLDLSLARGGIDNITLIALGAGPTVPRSTA